MKQLVTVVAAIAVVAAVAAAGPAHAVIITTVEAGLGVRLAAPPADAEALARRVTAAGLALRVTPSLTYDGQDAATAWYVVAPLGQVQVDRDGKAAAGFAPPSAADVARVEAALAKLGLSGEVRVWLLVQQAGGK